ncbi:hypothetical protein EYF80_017625 [Liparis tanakae]|uniref:Uncharacterized protein n=1 Tax=Liparis tanakae TaxID=230148 RepID=A0A4Z2I2I4_9TELE|nr:hypothetical protein EYF80_017625 [Liparis tanakae]
MLLWIACTSAWLVGLGAQNGLRSEMGRIVLFTAGPQGKRGWRLEEVGYGGPVRSDQLLKVPLLLRVMGAGAQEETPRL